MARRHAPGVGGYWCGGDAGAGCWADGQIIDILCAQEQHITADIAYAVWQYWQATEDVDFLLEAGAEILLETARFGRAVPSRRGMVTATSAVLSDRMSITSI